MPDWESIKTAYESGESVNSISKRFKISRSSIYSRATRKDWRRPETLPQKEDTAVRENAQIMEVAQKILDQMDAMLDNLGTSPTSLRFYTGALKDLKEVMGHKSPLDLKEQEARIAKLRKETEDEGEKKIEITINGGEDAWSE